MPQKWFLSSWGVTKKCFRLANPINWLVSWTHYFPLHPDLRSDMISRNIRFLSQGVSLEHWRTHRSRIICMWIPFLAIITQDTNIDHFFWQGIFFFLLANWLNAPFLVFTLLHSAHSGFSCLCLVKKLMVLLHHKSLWNLRIIRG